MVIPQRRRIRKTKKNQDFLGKKREESRTSPSYWETVDRPDRSCPEEDGEELLQLEEITPSMDSPLQANNLLSSAAATVKQSNHCQCQCSPAKRRSPFSEQPFLPSSTEEMPTAKRQLLLDEQDHAAVFALRGGYSKIVLPSPDQSSALPPLPPLGRTHSDASSVITKVVEGGLNSCKEFAPSAPAVVQLPPLHRTTSNSSNLEGSPNSNSWKGFSFSNSPQPTAMLPPRPPLHRTVSDPTPVATTAMEETPNSRRANRMMHRVKEVGKWFEHIVHQAEAEEREEHCRPKEKVVSQGLSSLALPQPMPILPPQPPLHRTVSDPTPAVMEETPNSKRVKNMLHKVKEMGKWFEHMVHEAEAEAEAEQGRAANGIVSQDGGEAEADEKDEEAVSVQKVGECLSVQFKCPCGKGYKILLSGKECYYKLS